MFAYYFNLALRSFKRNRMLTALMVLAIALGIGAAMTTLTVFYVLAGDPIPDKSDRLFHPQIEPRTLTGFTPGDDPSVQMTRFDAEALLRDRRGQRQALMSGGTVAVVAAREGMDPFNTGARYTTSDFFAMFNVPFLHGHGWTPADEAGRARVAVISKALNDRLFEGANSVGRTVRVEQAELRVIGVIDTWRPTPRFYDITNRRYGAYEDVFVPFWTAMALEYGTDGDMSCWDSDDANTDPEGNRGVNAPCAWLQYWVELASADGKGDYLAYLRNYSDQQRAAGRFERPTNVHVSNVMEWLDQHGVVPRDVRLQVYLAFGFLLVCLVNTVGLLLAKFMRRGSEIGVRRALGASRRAIFAQALVEAGTVGLAGGLLGLGLALLGLWAVRQQPTDYAEFARLDPAMLATTIALAIVASLLAGLLPAWRACQVTPAIQLKSQ